ncbi:superinfection exclusion [Serratia phage vB_Sru_IME250]|uniref:Superinfection exclusion protein n=1 Tax=Serratia phage vB_Sru_IME250 TaxID=1852640 RepID=A0A1J0MG62_9CAUD|nr:superinfection exclusion [Serratia phage vB_Sru_IME250]ANM47273.1 superinfection exclusion protein [Serratia phage vB_Sru_IME250]APD20181.1 superinfection exclusion protein [Serratia phage vB_Sru_IME250]
MSNRKFELKFRVWHVPQVPGKMFTVEVPTYAEAERLQSTLADYDLFQYENNIKPDYCNASGIQIYQHDLAEEEIEEMGLDDRWVDIDGSDDLEEYLDHLRSTGWEIK